MWPRLSNRYTCKSNYKVKPEPFYCTPKFGRNHNLILNMGLYLLIAKREFSLPFLFHIISYIDSKREVRLKIIERIAIFFWPFGPKFGLKIRGAGGEGASPGSATATIAFFLFFSFPSPRSFFFSFPFSSLQRFSELIELKKPLLPNPKLF